MTTVTMTENDGRQWYRISGTDYGTQYEFDDAEYGVTDDDTILDCDGRPMTEGDVQTIAVRNALRRSPSDES